jgi:N4-(beta-N-acetylglucosaminyl)-L-asparaginase
MGDRREFMRGALAAPALLAAGGTARAQAPSPPRLAQPFVLSTWDFGVAANQAAFAILKTGGSALDAVEAGARTPEADLKNHSVGRAGYPDRDGHVTLDASIMDHLGGCGAVAGMEDIAHPISVARRVMERTPHVLLVGEGATQFAVEQGFRRERLLTPESEAAWRDWLKSSAYAPKANSERTDYGRGLGTPGGAGDHDTIGMLAVDARGRIAGACTTSGMAWKLHGRVGDSPLIGAGLYVDDEVGGATSTGVGEEVIRTCGSFLVVELMRQGRGPQEACEEAVGRILRKNPKARDLQVGFLAVNKRGEVGAYAIQPGFTYALCDASASDRLLPSRSAT